MKKTRITTTNGNGLPVRTVHVEFAHQTATNVSIAGTFNDWRPAVTPMVSLGAGRWVKKPPLPPGVCKYCPVVDGCKWVTDPRARETASNPFGEILHQADINNVDMVEHEERPGNRHDPTRRRLGL